MSTKQEQIVAMFNDIAPTYDTANRILSMGADIGWRRQGCAKALMALKTHENLHIVDVATGTGDMLLHWRNASQKVSQPIATYTGIDPAEGMLAVAKEKVNFASFITAQAQNIPLENDSCDAISIAYGIRNVVNHSEAFKEFARILRSGGVVLILEFTPVKRHGIMGGIVDFYLDKVLPFIGGVISRRFDAYRYLPDSIEEFSSKEKLCSELEEAGFSILTTESMSFDISTMILAQKK